MTRIGWIGLGKLGLPCALALGRGAKVEVVGYDPDPQMPDILAGRVRRNQEEHVQALLASHPPALAADVKGVVAEADGPVFVAVQTPHGPAYGGEAPAPLEPQDFDYRYLAQAVRQVVSAAEDLQKQVTLVVVSTVLPGTMRRHILPLLTPRVTLIYNPFFIAMGTTVRDFEQPEFLLIGADDEAHAEPLIDLYGRMYGLGGTPLRVIGIESAELTKVAYNTFISMKVVFANTLMEICDKTDADVDEVTGSLALGTQRITSAAYLRGGMGDGGACHPRDNIAMSHLAQRLGLSVDPFRFVTAAREGQSQWLADFVVDQARAWGLPVVLLGKAYKANSDLTAGSPALLLAHQLRAMGVEVVQHDPHVDDGPAPVRDPAVFVICTRHPEYEQVRFPPGSVVIDPWRYIRAQDGVEVVSIGAGEDR